MNFIIILFTTLYVLASSLTHASCGDESVRTFKGDSAVAITYLFKNSTFAHKVTSMTALTWTLTKLTCSQSNRGVLPDLMPTYICAAPSGMGPITSEAFFDAMSELGILQEGAAGHIYGQAKGISCKLDKDGTGGTTLNPTCSIKAAWADECP